MAVTTPATLSLFLIVSLLSLSTTKTAATFVNPLTIPSCTGHPAMLKCAHDVEVAFVGTRSAQIGAGAHTIPLLLDSISAAKASYVNVLHFLSSKHIKSDISMSIQLAINIAMQELDQALKVVHGKRMLSSSELHSVEGFLKIANQKLTKSIPCLKLPNGNMSLSLRTLIDQSIKLTALSLQIFAQLSGKVSVGLTH